MAKFDGDSRELVYSSYLGGRGDDAGLSVAVDAEGAVSDWRNCPRSKREPQAPATRPQHESNGGWGLGYNAQLATDAKEKIVVGVELTNNASDAGQLTPTLDDVEGRFERTPKQVLADGGYANQANIEALAAAEIEYATPAPAPDKGSKAALKAAGIGPRYAPKFFIYDEATDTFLCPAQRTLTYQRSSLCYSRTSPCMRMLTTSSAPTHFSPNLTLRARAWCIRPTSEAPGWTLAKP